MRTSTSSPRRTSGAEARRHGIQPRAAARRRKPVRRPAVFSQRGASARTGMKRAGAARPRCGHGRFTRGRGRAVRRARLRARRPGRRPPDGLAEARAEEPRPATARPGRDRSRGARAAAHDPVLARCGGRRHGRAPRQPPAPGSCDPTTDPEGPFDASVPGRGGASSGCRGHRRRGAGRTHLSGRLGRPQGLGDGPGPAGARSSFREATPEPRRLDRAHQPRDAVRGAGDEKAAGHASHAR